MTLSTYNIRFGIAAHTAADWAASNPVLLPREFAYETDTAKFKVGDGVTAWNSIPYAIIPLTDGDKGDIVVSGGGTVFSIDAGVIVNADINASAAIAYSKLATLTASRALVSDGSGFVSVATATATEIGYLNGVTSAIQTQLNNKQPLDADLTTWAGITPGTGVGTALAVNVGSAGAFVVNGGALGTPFSGNLANCTFPTLNQNTTGSAASLTTSRNIYGNAFNGTADVTAIIGSAFGGTGNGFTKFTGPTTSEKTFTLPDANATIATLGQTQTFTGALTLTQQLSATILSATSYVAAGGGVQATGTRTYAGAGLGLQYNGTTCFMQGFDHGGGVYLPLVINGLTISFGPSGTNVMVLSTAGIVTTVTTYYPQGSGNSVNATATLTIAQMLAALIFCNSAVAVSYTLPTGTLTDAGVVASLANDRMFEWCIINLGSAAGAITMLPAAAGHTYTGNATIAIGTSAKFWTRKTAANTYVTYRVS